MVLRCATTSTGLWGWLFFVVGYGFGLFSGCAGYHKPLLLISMNIVERFMFGNHLNKTDKMLLGAEKL